MRRRNFIILFSGAAAAWPLAARAQRPKLFRLGYLEPGSLSDQVQANLRRQFLLGMRDLGHIEGRDFTMEDRIADGHLERLPALTQTSETAHQLAVSALLKGIGGDQVSVDLRRPKV